MMQRTEVRDFARHCCSVLSLADEKAEASVACCGEAAIVLCSWIITPALTAAPTKHHAGIVDAVNSIGPPLFLVGAGERMIAAVTV